MGLSFMSGFFVYVSWYMLPKLTEGHAGSRLPVVSQQEVTLPLLETNPSIRSCVKNLNSHRNFGRNEDMTSQVFQENLAN